MRANVSPRQSRKARIKVTGMLIKETSLRYHDFAALCLKLTILDERSPSYTGSDAKFNNKYRSKVEILFYDNQSRFYLTLKEAESSRQEFIAARMG